MTASQEQLERLVWRLRHEDKFYAEKLLKIVDQREQLVPLQYKPAQARLDKVIVDQEAEDRPVRVAVLKARREGISTAVQGRMIRRVTQREHHKGLVIAHDKKTSAELFQIGETMYSQLPDEWILDLCLKPPIVNSRKGQEMRFGEPSRTRRLEGSLGLNSSYLVDTANEYEGGRGFTYHSLHLSEFAFWQSPEKKLRALLSTVPDEPGSMVIVESTANGYNAFRKMWVAAISGNSDYYPLFIAWYEDPDYQRPFANTEDREAFIQTIGQGEFGEDEPALLETGLVTPEQLNWRRWAIVNRCHGDLRAFWQEFPATWEEAFLSSGRQVFAPALVAKVMDRTEQIARDPETVAERGLIRPTLWTPSKYMGQEIKLPAEPKWIPDAEAGDVGVATPRWEIWEHPFRGQLEDEERELTHIPPGQYVVEVDSASGAETVSEGQDYFAIQIIDHRTRAQVAQWTARGIDADLVRREAFLAALYYSPEFPPWLGVEITGGYGVSIATGLWRIFKYPMLYFRNDAATKGEKMQDRLGWSMDHVTKPLVVDLVRELLRTGRDGIRSKELAGQMQTFVRDEKGKMGAEEDYFDDLLDAWMIAQYIAQEKPPRRSKWGTTSSTRSHSQAPSLRRRPRPQRYAPR